MTMHPWTPEDLAPRDIGYWRGVCAGVLATLGAVAAAVFAVVVVR